MNAPRTRRRIEVGGIMAGPSAAPALRRKPKPLPATKRLVALVRRMLP